MENQRKCELCTINSRPGDFHPGNVCPGILFQVDDCQCIIRKTGFCCIVDQGGIFTGKVARILPGSLELSGEVLSENHALLSRF